MRLLLFGCNNPTGAYFLRMCADYCHEIWGRKQPKSYPHIRYVYCDLSNELVEQLPQLEGVLVSFAPVWKLAEFLKRIARRCPERVGGLRGIIACSSSSVQTKRFAFSRKDRELASDLQRSHDSLSAVSKALGIPCHVFAPTLVYGTCDGYSDKNVSQLVKMLRSLWIILLPAGTGYRQPIHASQLAEYALYQAKRMTNGDWSDQIPLVCGLGGDEILTYESMIRRIQDNLDPGDRGRNCRIIKVPDQVFFLLIAWLLPLNPKLCEACLRLNSNLSGFDKVHELIGTMPKDFPVLPLALDDAR